MEIDPIFTQVSQPALFDFIQDSTGAVELFPAVWSAAEDFTSPESSARHSGLERLEALQAPRLSPLVAYLLSTRLQDPDLTLRARIVHILGEIFLPDKHGRNAPDSVTQHLTWSLSQMHTRTIFALLQVANYDHGSETHVARLLNACAFAGNHLAGILSDRRAPLPIRKQAAHMIGLVGFLDVLPVIERIASRLEARSTGQQSMSFAPPAFPDERELLPAIQTALERLRSV